MKPVFSSNRAYFCLFYKICTVKVAFLKRDRDFCSLFRDHDVFFMSRYHGRGETVTLPERHFHCISSMVYN